MKSLSQFLVERSQHAPLSTTQIDLPKTLAAEVAAWGLERIPDAALVGPGRVADIHCTVLYGIHSGNPAKAKRVTEDTDPFTVRLGKTSVFRNEEFDVVKLSVDGKGLYDLNRRLAEACEHTSNHKYSAHVTVAYVAKGTGKKYQGDNAFLGRRVDVDRVKFSPPTGPKTILYLGRRSGSLRSR